MSPVFVFYLAKGEYLHRNSKIKTITSILLHSKSGLNVTLSYQKKKKSANVQQTQPLGKCKPKLY